jgi:hypothetical protein
LGSCIFLYVKHPYDVGDRVDIVGPEKEQLIVEKISLLYTVFVRIDKMQVVQVRLPPFSGHPKAMGTAPNIAPRDPCFPISYA